MSVLTASESIDRVVELAADHLDMDVAWVARFAGSDSTIQTAAGDPESFGAWEGQTEPLEGTYCTRMARGDLPNIVPDARADPRTAALDVTEERGIGAYVGVPLVLRDGRLYGTLCCLSHEPDPSLGARDVKFVELLARMLVDQLDREYESTRRRADCEARIRRALDGEGMRTVYQPIVNLPTLEICGAEALTRFDGGPSSPATWFEQAGDIGLGVELELAAIRSALAGLEALPPHAYVSINASPETAVSSRLHELLATVDPERIQLEVTERVEVSSYGDLLPALERLRAMGVRLAVDDAGAGYAGLRHILELAPDVIKLDVALSRDIDADPAREALARSLVSFGGHVGALIVAEGVETQAELDTLADLDIDAVQGYLLARPLPLPLADLAGVTALRRSPPATPAR